MIKSDAGYLLNLSFTLYFATSSNFCDFVFILVNDSEYLMAIRLPAIKRCDAVLRLSSIFFLLLSSFIGNSMLV